MLTVGSRGHFPFIFYKEYPGIFLIGQGDIVMMSSMEVAPIRDSIRGLRTNWGERKCALARAHRYEPNGGSAAPFWSPEHRWRRAPAVLRGGARGNNYPTRIGKNGWHREMRKLTTST